MSDEVKKKEAEKTRLEELVKEKKEIVQQMVNDRPSIWNKLKTMTSDERTKLTGEEHLMAAAMDDVINTQKSLENVMKQIGSLKLDIVDVEQSNRTIYDQVRSWESNIDENTVAEIRRQTQEFEKEELKRKARMESLRATIDEMNYAIDRLYAGADTKERLAAINDEYEERMELERRQHEEEAQANAVQTNETNKKKILN